MRQVLDQKLMREPTPGADAHRPMMMVLSLRLSWEVSIEGMVPDIERARDMAVGGDCGGERQDE